MIQGPADPIGNSECSGNSFTGQVRVETEESSYEKLGKYADYTTRNLRKGNDMGRVATVLVT